MPARADRSLVANRRPSYAVCCAALPVLRRKQPGDAGFRLPAGNFFAGIAVLMCAALVTQVDRSQSLIVAATIALGLLNWLVVRNRNAAGQT